MTKREELELLKMLSELHEAIRRPSEDLLLKFACYAKTRSEREFLIKEMYISDYALASVVDTERDVIEVEPDPDRYNDFVIGFDKYLERTEKEIDEIINDNRQALIVFRTMLGLEHPYSTLLYNEFFRELPRKELLNTMYMSKSTFYRKRTIALEKLNESLKKQHIEY